MGIFTLYQGNSFNTLENQNSIPTFKVHLSPFSRAIISPKNSSGGNSKLLGLDPWSGLPFPILSAWGITFWAFSNFLGSKGSGFTFLGGNFFRGVWALVWFPYLGLGYRSTWLPHFLKVSVPFWLPFFCHFREGPLYILQTGPFGRNFTGVFLRWGSASRIFPLVLGPGISKGHKPF